MYMWLFVNEDIANKYNDVYESIIRDTYRFTCFYDRKFKKLIPSESEFIKVCLSMECRNCTFEDILNYVNRNGNKIPNTG